MERERRTDRKRTVRERHGERRIERDKRTVIGRMEREDRERRT